MTEKISVYLIEDQVAYRTELKSFIQSLNLQKQDFLFNIIEVEHFLSFFKQMGQLTISDNDIFLIDIDLQTACSGIDLAKQIRLKNKHCFVLFLTNLDDKGIEVINQKINPTSYILKESSSDKLHLKKQLLAINAKIDQRIQNKEGYISFKKAGETIYIKYEDILYIQSISGVRNTLLIKTIHSEQIIDGAINKVKKEITSQFFYTQLKSFILNLTHIASLNYLLGLVVFDDGSELEVGEKIIYKLKKVL